MSQQPQAKFRSDYQSPEFTISDIDLVFDLDDTKTFISAISKVQQLKQSTDLLLEGEGMTLTSLKINDVEHKDYTLTDTQLTIHNVSGDFTLTIVTEVNPQENTALEGLYKSGDGFCTQCEAEGFRRITYYLDRPDVLARFTTKVIADKEAYPHLLSNGNRISQGDLDGGKHFVHWQDPFPKPAYLFALVAGNFDVLTDTYKTKSGRDVALEIYVDQGNLDRTPHAMTSLINSMKWDEDRFDLEYDLDIYMIVAVDFFNMGAMENKGLNVFNSKFVLAKQETATDTDYLGIEAVIGHEYFHNWTGNRVTCRDWFQLSLKEGLTVFRDQEFSSDLGSRSVNRINNVRIMRGPQFAEDASPMAHPIRPEKVIEMNNFYTLTVYEKGSEVIRMMHTLLGEVNFQKGMKLYFERHDGTAATCEDFVLAMEDASGVDLTQFRRWYSQSGTPTLSVVSSYDEASQEFTLIVKQQTPATEDQTEKLPLHIPLDIELYGQDGAIIELRCNNEKIDNVLNITQEKQTFVFQQVSEKPVISLLREFSAPVKLNYAYSDEELIFLMVHAQNDFARWDAGQMLLANYIRTNITNVQNGQALELPEAVVDAFRGVLLNVDLEQAFIAEMFLLPNHNEITGWFDTVDVDAIDKALGFIKQTLAVELKDEFSATYHSLKQGDYSVDHDAIGKRALRNCALSYLAKTDIGEALVQAQYQTADNMTDTMAAMVSANAAELPIRQTLMDDFSAKWSHDGLVMDKWFILQGSNPSTDVLNIIKETMNHKAFSLKNPNRTRSLIGSFAANNAVNFHSKSGEGYAFLGDILLELNESNPQVASRLIDPLLKFKKYDSDRQDLMKAQLQRLADLDNLAKDLFEKVTKALA
ncbi:aminopeptidase N [Aliivibrio finisterrensis]|uniref:Aminopeptidase N n=1 Tax=Aliivibrio finisterrensis TaxID=511998 RepID=A0A4Q5KN50_9GAMM|nr:MULTISPECIES: aminopeptidase N [Aliivibrio]MDD9173808.1 aminopeptidase N [Aliivibrio sp. S3TY1]MDD9190885.1 aminopeptidase N [Aliivibrio sp. S2TY2]RYU46308.1 aminopeptidase N [Aliivibrio finisterrensis]